MHYILYSKGCFYLKLTEFDNINLNDDNTHLKRVIGFIGTKATTGRAKWQNSVHPCVHTVEQEHG